MKAELCEEAALGYCLFKLHGDVLQVTPTYWGYNPRGPPTLGVTNMVTSMKKGCSSDVDYILAAVSKDHITNLAKLPSAYVQGDYKDIPYATFHPSARLQLLTGGTRSAASKIIFQALQPKEKGKDMTKAKEKAHKDLADRTTPLFKIANWVVKLYDFGM